MRGVGRKAADLIERTFQPVEHLVQQFGKIGKLIRDFRHIDALAQIIRTNAVGGVADDANRFQHQLAQAKPDRDADQQHCDDQGGAHLHIDIHGLPHLAERRADQYIERFQEEFADAQRADAVKIDVELGLALDVGNRPAVQIGGTEQVADTRDFDIDIKQHRGVVGGLADALINDFRGKGFIALPQMRLDLVELGFIEQIEAVDEPVFKQKIADHEQARQRRGRGQRVPEREARADRFHISW